MNLRNIFPRLFDIVAARLIRRARRTPYTHLHHADDTGQPAAPYMLRYWLFHLGRSGKHGDYPWIGARVHVICSSDDDRAFHDHPWPFISLLLRGSYTELRPYSAELAMQGDPHTKLACELIGGHTEVVHKTTRRTGSLAFRRAHDWHMVRLAPGKSAITLFVTLPAVQDWGFLAYFGRLRRKVHHREFEREHGGGIVVVNPR